MYFTNPRSVSKNKVIIQPKNNNISMMNIVRKPSRPRPTEPIQTTAISNQKKDEMLWGAPTWYFFHTIAEKIKVEYFADSKVPLFNLIKSVCMNLPCPSCTEHATQYIEKININSIKSKEDFIMLYFNFHNEINKRKNKPIFTYEELREKYSKANIINIVNNFLYYYKMEHHAVRMIADNMHRKRNAKQILDWLHTNLHIFE